MLPNHVCHLGRWARTFQCRQDHGTQYKNNYIHQRRWSSRFLSLPLSLGRNKNHFSNETYVRFEFCYKIIFLAVVSFPKGERYLWRTAERRPVNHPHHLDRLITNSNQHNLSLSPISFTSYTDTLFLGTLNRRSNICSIHWIH